jgi:uncharacterized protein (DUF924 family)
MQPRDVIDFWFAGVQADPAGLPERMRFWFGSGNDDAEEEVGARDRAVAARFGPYMEARRSGRLDHWAAAPAGRLALILLTDQFPRNVHRGSAAAFADDGVARRLCLEGLDAGQDRQLAPIERVFFYMPLEHAESRADQARCVALMAALERDAPPGQEAAYAGFTRFAAWHQEIIERFGRFPHRNRVLGRADTPEEAAYLAAGAPAFGQRR